MRILAASQADEVAVEADGEVAQGLLTYALFREGLRKRRAAGPGTSPWGVFCATRQTGCSPCTRRCCAAR
jgi:hypothetical protein